MRDRAKTEIYVKKYSSTLTKNQMKSFEVHTRKIQHCCKGIFKGNLVRAQNKKKTVEEDLIFLSVQFSSVAQSCPTLCDPMNCSTPGLPIHHHLPEFT